MLSILPGGVGSGGLSLVGAAECAATELVAMDSPVLSAEGRMEKQLLGISATEATPVLLHMIQPCGYGEFRCNGRDLMHCFMELPQQCRCGPQQRRLPMKIAGVPLAV